MVGSSHIRRWPNNSFPSNFNIYKLDTSTSIIKIAKSVATISLPATSSNPNQNFALIAAGGNNIGQDSISEIFNAINKTARILRERGLQPIILPILHRQRSTKCPEIALYNSSRQKINKMLRGHFSHHKFTYNTIINIPQKLPLHSDLVHLSPVSYEIITGQVIFHIQGILPNHQIIPSTPPPFTHKVQLIENKISNKIELIEEKIEIIEEITEILEETSA